MSVHRRLGVPPLLIPFLLLVPLSLTAQTGRFQTLSIDAGLSQSIVESIVQDRSGFMWFGTEDGLNRYDGYAFTVIRRDPDNPNSPSHNHILVVFEDREGRLWFGTYNGGVNMYDPKRNVYTRYRNDPANPRSVSHDLVRAIAEDAEGKIWIGTERGLNRIDLSRRENLSPETARFDRFLPDTLIRCLSRDRLGSLWVGTAAGLFRVAPGTAPAFIRYTRDPANPASLNNNVIRSITQDHAGLLWVGTEGGLHSCNPAAGKLRFRRYLHDPRDPGSLVHDQVLALLEDRFGNLWVGTNGGGLDLFDREAGTFIHHRHDTRDAGSLGYDEVRCLYEDRSGNLWAGTYGGGISKLDRARKAFVHVAPDPTRRDVLNHAIIWCFHEDPAGVLWIGTHGGGINRYDRKKGTFTYYRNDPRNPRSLGNDVVRMIIPGRDSALWIGTDGGGVNRMDPKTGTFIRYEHDPQNPNSLSNNQVRAMCEDREGNIWVGTLGGGITKIVPGKEGVPPRFVRYRHDPENPSSLAHDYIRHFHEDRTGAIWVATYGGGLDRFDPATGRFTHHRADPRNPESLNSDFIFCILEDVSGFLWVGTYGGGLNRFDPSTGKCRRYTTKQGLASDAIYAILRDGSGFLWLSTPNGLIRFDPATERCRNFNVSDGIQSREFNGGAALQTASGEMFFGGINGFNSFHPEEIVDNAYVPPVVITSFKKLNREAGFDVPLSEVRQIVLSPGDYVFSFEFAALDYTAPRNNLYAYKMEGLDADWMFTTSDKRFAHYTTLPPGRYTFRVKGSNNDGIWNENGTAIAILIRPPFWREWWFVLLCLVALAAIGYTVHRRRVRIVRMRTELRTAHEAQMSIMPHEDPQVPGFDISGICLPANEVGGDFFDYLWLDEESRRFGITVGDVSGKAMRAAMTAVMTCGMIRLSARQGLTAADMLTNINTPLHAETSKDIFIAICAVTIDAKEGSLFFTNAGLEHPLLKRNGEVLSLASNGTRQPVGLLKENRYTDRPIEFGEGDVLLLTSDGITEARNRAKEYYGAERLTASIARLDTRLLTAREIRDKVLEDVKTFAGNAPVLDDMTLVVVKKTG